MSITNLTFNGAYDLLLAVALRVVRLTSSSVLDEAVTASLAVGFM